MWSTAVGHTPHSGKPSLSLAYRWRGGWWVCLSSLFVPLCGDLAMLAVVLA